LARDDEVKKLSIEAIRVANESPQASILLGFAAIERMDKSGVRFPPDLKDRVEKLREVRNGIAHGPLLERGYPGGFKEILFDTLRFASPRR
jgi:hypothetical protein